MNQLYVFGIALTSFLFFSSIISILMNLLNVPLNVYMPYLMFYGMMVLFIIVLPQEKNIFKTE